MAYNAAIHRNGSLSKIEKFTYLIGRPTERGGQRGQFPGPPTKQGSKKQETAPQLIEKNFTVLSYY